MNRQPPTYLLDENYYLVVDKLANEVEIKMKTGLEGIIKDYISYLKTNKIEKPRSFSEYGLELLYIGALYISYSKEEGETVYKKLESLCVWLESTKEFDEIT